MRIQDGFIIFVNSKINLNYLYANPIIGLIAQVKRHNYT